MTLRRTVVLTVVLFTMLILVVRLLLLAPDESAAPHVDVIDLRNAPVVLVVEGAAGRQPRGTS